MTAPSGPLETPLNFFSHTNDGAYPYSCFYPTKPQNNIVSAAHTVLLHDMRGCEDDFDVDVQGFLPVRGVASLALFLLDATSGDVLFNDDVVKAHFDALVRRLFPHTTFLDVFRVMLRSSDPKEVANGRRKPSPLIHIDQTPSAGAAHMTDLPPDVQEGIVAGRLRVRILSLWQPLVSVVHNWPMAMADARTVPPSALLDSETRLTQGRRGAMSLMTYTPDATWWYWSAMTCNDMLVLKNFDSIDAKSRTPHTSFADPRAPPHSHRQSVEARVLVVTDVV
ncbi:Aste57867_9571 [Aphanomyces stellatus]|uniref:Aste57867_9571 protein n=1 Tax=Aphanomyces stellatus TaxID=120398 RepID=A0A485KN72_9STRA|nr:hypothetical protein As57867_009533 [Aphanomyces stellatus]VFT86450.1 Aste57867_9571 [Aphanomyces stellatus]